MTIVAAGSPDGLYHYGIGYLAHTIAGTAGRGHAILGCHEPILYNATCNMQQAAIAEAIRLDFPPSRGVTDVIIVGITLLAVPRPMPMWLRIITALRRKDLP
jgi:hypothetical protein